MADSTTAYKDTYTTFSGCDIVCSFGSHIIGEIQGISYSVTREKAPVYTMGCADPRSFSRGKRGIAGTLVFVVFDRDALVKALADSGKIHRIGANITSKNDGSETSGIHSIEEWDKMMSDHVSSGADDAMPFDITISMANEYGKAAVLVLYGVEILNEGMQFSIDTIQTQKACTFVARRVKALTAVAV